jgi:hypothetical protein
MSTHPQSQTADTNRTQQTEPTTTELTARGETDRWAAETAEQHISPLVAPLTFDPFCTKRLRNCTDEENAALPSPTSEE